MTVRLDRDERETESECICRNQRVLELEAMLDALGHRTSTDTVHPGQLTFDIEPWVATST